MFQNLVESQFLSLVLVRCSCLKRVQPGSGQGYSPPSPGRPSYRPVCCREWRTAWSPCVWQKLEPEPESESCWYFMSTPYWTGITPETSAPTLAVEFDEPLLVLGQLGPAWHLVNLPLQNGNLTVPPSLKTTAVESDVDHDVGPEARRWHLYHVSWPIKLIYCLYPAGLALVPDQVPGRGFSC